MRQAIVIIIMLVTGHASFGQPFFKTLRFDEDYRYLKNDTAKTWYKRAKYYPLSKEGNSFVSFGGDIRYQYFRIHNDKWGDLPEDRDGYIFSRLLLHSDLHLGKNARLFSQLQSSMANGKALTSPVDEDPLELHQLFAESEMNIGPGSKLLFRAGRQELSYGSQRLIGVRDGPNNRQSFDAVKASLVSKRYHADLFYSHYVKAQKGLFNDSYNPDTKCWGAYMTMNAVPAFQNIDLYYLGIWRRNATFNDGAGKELRHSIGTRIFSQPHKIHYDIEWVYQFGELASKQINAWTVSFNTGYQIRSARFKPEFGLKTELISGDRRNGDKNLQTFNPLFPRGGYFGLASLIGPSNLFDIHPSLGLFLPKHLQLNLEADVFWRLSQSDGIYGPNVALIYPGNDNPYTRIGNQYAADLSFTPNPYLYFRLEFTWFDAGKFLRAAGAGRDILFSGITAQLKF